jgi:phenylalanyl-tRNA synthetase beta subunit
MKIIYSKLKKLLPGLLDKKPEQLINDLALIGHFVDGVEKINGETIISLEIRQNRGDCLGYWGIVKELAVLYDLKLKAPKTSLPPTASSTTLPITVKSPNQIARIMAVKIGALGNRPTPNWLKNFLIQHDIRSINTLVDLTNYIMILWGMPNHAFDAQKSTDQLIWETNQERFKTFITFDGTEVSLKKTTLQISNNKEVLSIAGIIGGRNSGVELETKEAIIEMAIYNSGKIRRDSQQLKITTEASTRLEKQLDPNLIPQAFRHLIYLILKYCQGEIASKIYDYYPRPIKPATIEFNPQKPSLFSGIKIEPEFSQKILRNLGCQVKSKTESAWRVIPPSSRTDLKIEEDLIEEVIRFFGYQKIPTDQPISAKIFPDITPKIIHLAEAVQNILVNLGYDEIRSWPLIKKNNFIKANFLPKEAKAIHTQNNVNNRYPVLRASILSSLKSQYYQYLKLKITQKQFFEIGKIFWKTNDNYQERWSLGIFDQSAQNLNKKIKRFYRELGLPNHKKPLVQKIGRGRAAEINLDQLAKELGQIPKITLLGPPQLADKAAKELTSQIISLDANLTFPYQKEPKEIILEYQTKFNPDILWQLALLDVYQEKNKYKYTLRAFYYHCSLEEAKQIHRKIFET